MADKDFTFILFPTSYKMLGEEVSRLVSAYQNKEISETVLRQTVDAWKENVPDLLYADESHTTLANGLMRHIGTRRGRLILWAANS